MLKGLLISGALLLLWGGGLLVVLQTLRPRLVFVAMLTLFAATVPGYLLAFLLTPSDLGFLPARLSATPFALGLINGLFVHTLLFLTGVQFYFHIDRSITIRLLTEFERAPSGELSLAQIRRVYGLDVVIQARLDAMVTNAFLVHRGGLYYLAPKGRLGAWAGRLFRSLFRLKPL